MRLEEEPVKAVCGTQETEGPFVETVRLQHVCKCCATKTFALTQRQQPVVDCDLTVNCNPVMGGLRPFLANLRNLDRSGGGIYWNLSPFLKSQLLLLSLLIQLLPKKRGLVPVKAAPVTPPVLVTLLSAAQAPL